MIEKWKCPKCGRRTQIAWHTCDSCNVKSRREMTAYLHLSSDCQEQGFPLDSDVGQLFTVKRLLNGNHNETFEIRCLNQYHRNAIVERWNREGAHMAKTPQPVSGDYFHWTYEVCDTGHDETLFPQPFLGEGI